MNSLEQKTTLNASALIAIIAMLFLVGVIGWRDPAQTPVIIEEPKVDTSSWKTYRNEKYGFEVIYPADWVDDPSVILQLGHSQGQSDAEISEERFSIVFQPEKATCGHGVGCFYPGKVFMRVIDKAELVPWRQGVLSAPFSQYAEEYVKSFYEKGTSRSLTIGNRPAVEIYPQGFTKGPMPEREMFIEHSSTSVLWIEVSAYPGDRVHALSVYQAILSSLKFIEPTSQADTSSWKTYRNEKYGFEIKYPPTDLPIETRTDTQYQYVRIQNYTSHNPYDDSPGLKPEEFYLELLYVDPKLNHITDRQCPGDLQDPRNINLVGGEGYIGKPVDAGGDVGGSVLTLCAKKDGVYFYVSGVEVDKKLVLIDQILSTFKFIK